MNARSLLLLFVLLLLQAAPTKGLLGGPAPSCSNSVLSASSAVSESGMASDIKAMPTVLSTPLAQTTTTLEIAFSKNPAREAGGCCGGNTARDAAPEALEGSSENGSGGGCKHCTCTADEATPHTAEFPAPPTPPSKSLAPGITWILAGLETFVRDLLSLGNSSASFLKSLCITPVQRVERNVFHCVFQT